MTKRKWIELIRTIVDYYDFLEKSGVYDGPYAWEQWGNIGHLQLYHYDCMVLDHEDAEIAVQIGRFRVGWRWTIGDNAVRPGGPIFGDNIFMHRLYSWYQNKVMARRIPRPLVRLARAIDQRLLGGLTPLYMEGEDD